MKCLVCGNDVEGSEYYTFTVNLSTPVDPLIDSSQSFVHADVCLPFLNIRDLLPTE